MAESSKPKPWWFTGLFLRLAGVSFLVLLFVFMLGGVFVGTRIDPAIWRGFITVLLLIGYAWAIYFRFPFFVSRTKRQRLFISTGIALPTVFLTYYCVTALLTAAVDFASTSDKRTESVTLPSGEVLENHTYYESGFLDGERYNKLFLKNPAKSTSELVGDLNYEAGPDTPSLFAQSPHPQEFIYGDEKVLVVGSYICKRWKFNNGPYWYITPIGADADALAYMQSFLPTNDIPSYQRGPGSGEEGEVQFVFDNLDLTNNILTIKKQTSEWKQWDAFPRYLVYSSVGYHGGSGYEFQ
jgi:hypothetical protein